MERFLPFLWSGMKYFLAYNFLWNYEYHTYIHISQSKNNYFYICMLVIHNTNLYTTFPKLTSFYCTTPHPQRMANDESIHYPLFGIISFQLSWIISNCLWKKAINPKQSVCVERMDAWCELIEINESKRLRGTKWISGLVQSMAMGMGNDLNKAE